MGVLDSFVFLFETDNNDALRGMRETEQAESDVKDGAHDANSAMLNMFNGVAEKTGITIGSFKELAVATLGIAGAGLSLSAVLDHTAEMLQRVRDAETVGVDISQYDALSRTFQALGVDADGFRDSMIDLNEAIGEAASDAGSGKAKSFKQLGVALTDSEGKIKTADVALLELSGTLSKMDKQQATFQIKQLGITDNAVITAMLKGQKALERQIEFQKELGVTSKKDAEELERFAEAQNELSAIFTRFADVLAMTVVPALDLVIDTTVALIKWGREHKGFLIGFFGALAGVAIPMLASALWGMATAAWAAVAPFLPLIAIGVALGLVIDDLWTYFNGGESVIGDLVKRFPMLGAVLEGAKETVLGLWDALKVLFTDPEQFMSNLIAELKRNWDILVSDGESAVNALLDAISKVWEKLSTETKAIFNELLEWIKGLFSKLGSYISDTVSNAANAAYDALPDFVKKGIEYVTGDDDEQPASPVEEKKQNDAKAGKEDPPRQQNSPGGQDMLIPGDVPEPVPAQREQRQGNETDITAEHSQIKQPPVPKKKVSNSGTGSEIDTEHNPIKQPHPAIEASQQVAKTIADAPVIPPASVINNNNRPTTVQNTQKIENVNITTGAGDPQQIRTAVTDGMSDSAKQMANQYDNGVSH